MADKKPRDFNARPADERQAFLEQTWCDACMEPNLGMHGVCEYELEKTIFVEGKCNRCKQPVVTELTDEDF